MRILYHHRSLGDGAEGIHIASMVAAFASLGHEVHVCGLATSRGDRPHKMIHALRQHSPAAMFELASMASNVPDYLNVRRAMRVVQPDFVYKRHARNDVGALDASAHSGVPTVLEVNCLYTSTRYERFEPTHLRRLSRAFEVRALALATVVVAVSTPLAAEIERVAAVRAVAMPNGADPLHFDPSVVTGERVRSRYGLGTALTIGWTGIMREWHGLELLLDVVSRLPHARLLLVGDGPARTAVERSVAELGIGGRVVITGRVDQSEMPAHLAAMDIAVVARDGTTFASPMKLLEYMAMERAIVAPAGDNIRDLVTHDVEGLLFAPDDAGALAETVRRLGGDEALRIRLGRAARRRVQTVLNWKRNAERVISLVAEHATESTRHTAIRPRGSYV